MKARSFSSVITVIILMVASIAFVAISGSAQASNVKPDRLNLIVASDDDDYDDDHDDDYDDDDCDYDDDHDDDYDDDDCDDDDDYYRRRGTPTRRATRYHDDDCDDYYDDDHDDDYDDDDCDDDYYRRTGTPTRKATRYHTGTPTRRATSTPQPSRTPTVTPQAGGSTAVIGLVAPGQPIRSSAQQTCIEVQIANAKNLGSFAFTVTYPADLLSGTSATLGSFLGSTGRSASSLTPTTQAGALTFGGFSSGSQRGPDGSGTLANICFVPRAAGTVALTFRTVQTTDINGQVVPVRFQGTTFQITTNCLREDTDCDGDVDIADIQRVASKFNSRAGDGVYEAKYDMDNDGDIDVVDVQRVASAFNPRGS